MLEIKRSYVKIEILLLTEIDSQKVDYFLSILNDTEVHSNGV